MLVVAFALEFPVPVGWCFALIVLSAGLNLYLSFRYPSTHRLSPLSAIGILSFDALQLGGTALHDGGADQSLFGSDDRARGHFGNVAAP